MLAHKALQQPNSQKYSEHLIVTSSVPTYGRRGIHSTQASHENEVTCALAVLLIIPDLIEDIPAPCRAVGLVEFQPTQIILRLRDSAIL